MNSAPFVDTTLLNNILVTSISAVGVTTLLGQLIRSSPTGFDLFGSHGGYELSTCDIFSAGLWDFIFAYEFDSVGGVFASPTYPIIQTFKLVSR